MKQIIGLAVNDAIPEVAGTSGTSGSISDSEIDEWDMPVFAFHDLDYIPSGYGGILAPYIETGVGTMRAAASLMRLDIPPPSNQSQRVVCDLGCGDGEFLIGLLSHINIPSSSSPSSSPHNPNPIQGFGVDYNASLIDTAISNSLSLLPPTITTSWLVYDFNLDEDDLFCKLIAKGVTHVFIYLVPKQLALKTVRTLLEKLCNQGVLLCAHKFQPDYLDVSGRDEVMDLCIYERG